MRTSKKIVNKKAKDPIDVLIFDKGVRAKDLVIYKQLDLMILILNNGNVFTFSISDYPRLRHASEKDLKSWKMIGGGIGFHWEKLDEDLSLKGFIQSAALNNTLKSITIKNGLLAVN